MNTLYLIGSIVLLVLLGYPYLLLILANKEKGFIRVTGFVLSAAFVLLLFLLILLGQLGLLKTPNIREGIMPNRATPRMMHGWSGYIKGMMLEDEKTIDVFIESLRSDPKLYQKFKEKIE